MPHSVALQSKTYPSCLFTATLHRHSGNYQCGIERTFKCTDPWRQDVNLICIHQTYIPYVSHLGVPTHSTFLYPRAARVSSRKWELWSVNRYWALHFLLSRGCSSTLGRLSCAAMTAVDLWLEWASCSPGRRRSWQSWQNFFSSSGSEANFLNLRDKLQIFWERVGSNAHFLYGGVLNLVMSFWHHIPFNPAKQLEESQVGPCYIV